MRKEVNAKQWDIEDTGQLMTGSGSRKKMIRRMLLIITILVVLATAIIGTKMIREKRYNDQITIADKAFVEGDYRTAEIEYIKAVDMNKRKPKARESLAYTYALQEKGDEAVTIYRELYEDTNDKKYLAASEVVAKGNLPTDSTLIPALGMWRVTNVDEIPFYYDAANFLHGFYHDYLLGNNGHFDSENPKGFPSLRIYMTGIAGYGFEIAVEDADKVFDDIQWVEGMDPRRWAAENDAYDLYGGYQVYDVKNTNLALKEVFNITDKDIEESLQQSEEERQIYIEGDSYYCVNGWPTGTPGYGLGIELQKAWTDGEKYCIQYDAGFQNDDVEYDDIFGIDRGMDYTTYYAVLQAKTFNNKHFWSLYYNGKEIPNEVSALQNTQTNDKRGIKDNLDEWEVVNESSVQDYNGFIDFISRYMNFSGPTEYDSRKAADSDILKKITGDPWFVDETIYPFKLVGEGNHSTPDPREWEDEGWHEFMSGGRDDDRYYYLVLNAKAVEWISKVIFNTSEDDITKLLQRGENKREFYKNGDSYYYVAGTRTGVGIPPEITVKSVKRHNDYYYIDFSSQYEGLPDTYIECYTLMQLKDVDGSLFWSMLLISESPLEKASGLV